MTVTDDQHRDRAIAKLHMLVNATWQGVPPRIVEDEAAALLQHIAALQRDHAASAARVEAADALAQEASAACGIPDRTRIDRLTVALLAYRKLAQPDAARPAGEQS